MRNMSFMLTTQQMYDRTKDVTRRIGWWNLKPGDAVMAVEKGMGLKKGEKVKRIYPIRILSVGTEFLHTLIEQDDYGKKKLYAKVSRIFCHSHGGNHVLTYLVNRIEFEEVKDYHATP